MREGSPFETNKPNATRRTIMKTLSKTFVLMSLLALAATGAAAQDAYVQIIHNSPDPAATTVDIYVNDALAIPDFAFRTATGQVALPANTDLAVGIAPGDSNGPEDIIAVFNYNLPEGSETVIMAAGLIGDMDTPFNLFVNPFEAGGMAGEVGVLAFHGSPDAPAVDIEAMGVGILFPNIAFGEFQGYLYVPENDYVLVIKPAGSDDVVAMFEAPLNGLGGAAAVVFASGFLGSDPGFGLYAALPDGTVVELPPVTTANASASWSSVKALW
jgi:hypothetical protein